MGSGLARFIIGVALLSFLAGASLIQAKIWPYPLVNDAYRTAKALWFSYKKSQNPQSTLWFSTWTENKGAIIYQAGASFGEYTLFSNRAEPGAKLINLSGGRVHQWKKPLSEIVRETGFGQQACGDEFVFWDHVRMGRDGELIAILICPDKTPWGVGVLKLDADSNIIWWKANGAHHDFDVAPNGDVYVLTHEIVSNQPDYMPASFSPPYVIDYLVVLDGQGEQLKKFDLVEAMLLSNYKKTVRPNWTGDLLHANGVSFVTEEISRKFPFSAPGQVLFSLRTQSAAMLFDLNSGDVPWLKLGLWNKQHDFDFLDNGKMLVFDNYGRNAIGLRSRVLEFDPLNDKTEWAYEGQGLGKFNSWTMSSQQRLPNGNTLITMSEEGRLLEVAADGSLIWEYVTPIRSTIAESLMPALRSAHRYSKKDASFLN
ncbi:MAG: arylsulfotransferase family protein [Oceanococcus sp.]